MLCFLCGKKIGFFRSLVDQQYCCAQHRAEARLVSAQALREEDELELWSVNKTKGKPSTSASQTASLFAFMIVGALLVAAMFMGDPAPPRQRAESLDPGEKQGLWDSARNSIAGMIRSQAPVTLRDDFSQGLKDWTTAAVRTAGRVDDPKGLALTSDEPGVVRPGSLRIWNRSTSLENYQMEFMGELEKKSLSWAFRAGDAGARRQLPRPRERPGRPLYHVSERPGDQFLERRESTPRRRRVLRQHRRSAKGRLGEPLG